MSNNRFVVGDDDILFPSETSQCKTCIYRDTTSEYGYRLVKCEKYPLKKEDKSDRKPTDILFKNKNCTFYKKGN